MAVNLDKCPAPHVGMSVSRIMGLLGCVGVVWGALGPMINAQTLLKLHPSNNHYFLFRGKPTVLIGSTEHYGAQINLDFDYIRYFEETRTTGLNLVRIFSGSYFEVPGEFYIADNTLAPEPGRSIFPWKRSSTPGAGDGGNKFDLSEWDPAYFHRLRDFVREAGKRGIVVEFTLFSAMYTGVTSPEAIWDVSPMNSANNVNSVGAGGRKQVYLPTSDLLPYQKALAQKVATELRGFDNVILEVINEPYWHNFGPNNSVGSPYLPSNPSYQAATLAWENLIIAEIVATQAAFPQQHLIASNVANFEFPISAPNPSVSIFNFHYSTPDAAAANYGLNRAIGNDETGGLGEQDFPYRSQAWEFMMAGGSLVNHLDYSFTATREDGGAGITPFNPFVPANQPGGTVPSGGGPALRHQLAILRWFLEELPLLDLTPQTNLVVGGVPADGAVRAIGAPGMAYGVYVRGGSQTDLALDLPAATYSGQWLDTRSGLVIGTVSQFVHSGGSATLNSPAYFEDVVLRLNVGSQPPPQVQITSPVYNMVVGEGTTSLKLAAEASVSSGAIARVEFFNGEISLGVDPTFPYEITLTSLKPGYQIYRARVTTTDGRTSLSPPIKFTVEGPLVVGVNLNGGALQVGGQPMISQQAAVTAGLVTGNATPVAIPVISPVFPAGDEALETLLASHLIRSSADFSIPLTLAYPIPNGHYEVYLYTSEDASGFSRDMKVSLEGETVIRGIGDIAQEEWRKYGPYKTSVADGILNIELTRHTKGTPKIAAFAVYQAPAPPVPGNVSLKIRTHENMVLLSYPQGLVSPQLQFTDTLTQPGSWQNLPGLAADFSEFYEVPTQREGRSRFYRLKMD